MTVTARYAARLAVAALLLCAAAAGIIGALVAVATPHAQPAHAAVTGPATATPTSTTADPLLAVVAPASDLDDAQAQALSYAGDRVCEGIAAGVPADTMVTTLAADLGLTIGEARIMVAEAPAVRGC